ncbi:MULTISPECIES: hypothetical protein [Okeania]|uniref:hypothetical protein n=1 Tax=Okeania TaxID=1458928 RepID=UPI000F533F8D|nr:MULTISPECIES: hypothetical protein [Okeania]NES90047.1 hypothetical protein [Okeania sp. SIO2B9]NET75346.1 hypothetical protein [Okeania sp. SIO1F9]
MTFYSTKKSKVRILRDCSDREAWHQPYRQQQIKLLERAEHKGSLKTREKSFCEASKKQRCGCFVAIASTLPNNIAPYSSHNFHSTKLTHLLSHKKSNKYHHQISQIINQINIYSIIPT